MDIKAKWPIFVLILLLIAALAVLGLSYAALSKEKEVNAGLNKKIEEIEAMKNSAQRRVEELQKMSKELKDELEGLNKRLLTANSEIEQERKTKADALIEVSRVKEELAAANKQKEQTQKAKNELEQKLRENEETISALNKDIEALKSEKQVLAGKIKDLEKKAENIQLGEIVVQSQAGGVAVTEKQPLPPSSSASAAEGSPADLEGKVLVVNKDYDFIVVNLGRKDNIKLGDVFQVFRNNRVIGQFKVEEIRDTMSVASPFTKGMTKDIKEEDLVVYQQAK